ncbi:MAG: hypothetical protein R8K20_11675 [Gallionellaceae bacterium]
MKCADLIIGKIYNYTEKDGKPIELIYNGSDKEFKSDNSSLLYVFICVEGGGWSFLKKAMVNHRISEVEL